MTKPYSSRLQAAQIQSAVIAVSTGSITLNIDPNYPHNFAGVEFYSDAQGTTPVQPASGSVIFSVKTVNRPTGFQAIEGGTISAVTVDQVSWSGNSTQVRATFDTIVGATHARLIYSGNQS